MGIELVGDLDTFLDTDEFAVEATYKTRKIKIIFDAGFDPVTIGQLEVEGVGPTVTVKSSDVDGVAHNDELVIPVTGVNTKYKVVGIQPDGTGMTTLILMEA